MTCHLPLRSGMRILLHLPRPFQKSPEMVALPPAEIPELEESDLRHLDAGVGLDAPEKIRTSPRSQAMAFRGVPQETKNMAHDLIRSIACEPCGPAGNRMLESNL